jgi:multidrug resistance efflux pump
MAILVTAGFFYSIIGVWDYKVEGNAMLKTDSVSYISAPYDGLISDVYVHEGDEVHRGDHLLKLDTKELVLKEAQESARKISFEREVEKNRAGEEYADMQIAQSRLRETQAELERIRYYLDQADIKAQFEGIVVEGDKRELMGSPVSQGDILLKIARIDAMYATVKISERDIDQIAQGARGQLILLSRPNDTFDIVIDKIVPMAEVDQREGNVFIIKAGIGGKAQAWWRPGMSGIAKINAGEKKIIWIMTHRLTEFIRMYFWW